MLCFVQCVFFFLFILFRSFLFHFFVGRARVLCATDVAARGLDIAGVGLVVHYDAPVSLRVGCWILLFIQKFNMFYVFVCTFVWLCAFVCVRSSENRAITFIERVARRAPVAAAK